MGYTLTFKPDFMKDLIRYGRNDQTRISRCISDIEANPNVPKGSTIKPLKYANNLWRYRFGKNRIVYAVFPKREAVTLLMVDTRDKIYGRLNCNPDGPDLSGFNEVLEKALNPDEEAPPDWSDYVREDTDKGTPLNYIFTKNQLNEWEIPAEYHNELMGCRTEESLLDCDIPDFYIEKVIDLMSPPGRIEEIVEQPTRVIDHVDSILEFRDGKKGILDFLLYLDEDQEKLVDWSLGGPTLVKGGAGSGKSTIALYRARELCELAKKQLIPPKILFATYTNALIKASQQLLGHLIPDEEAAINVSTVDSIAMKIYKSDNNNPGFADDSFINDAIKAGKKTLEISGENQLQNYLMKTQIDGLGDEYIKDEFKWVIQGRGIQSEEDYLKANRKGRGYGFNENMRRQIWKIYQYFLFELDKEGRITWEMLRSEAYQLLNRGGLDDEKYDYVLIDEAQDLSPMAIKLCMALCCSPKGVFLTADAGQSIYNRGFSWNRVHEDLKVKGRTRILKRNYRTTREIATAANHILRNPRAGDVEVLDQFYVHSGPKPRYFEARDEDEMLYWIYQSIIEATYALNLPNSAAAVVFRRNRTASRVAKQLSSLGLPFSSLGSNQQRITDVGEQDHPRYPRHSHL